jgi:DNA modification methylase
MGKWLDYLDYADLVFTCPPYWDMEKYSKDENDLSTFKTYDEFLDGCNSRLELASQYLKDDGFLVVVLMDFRRKGILHSWHTDTINHFHNNTDFKLYDTIIWEMSPAKRHPLYPQALLNRRMLNAHEYCLVFNRKTQPELREFYDKKLEEDEIISKNDKINEFF